MKKFRLRSPLIFAAVLVAAASVMSASAAEKAQASTDKFELSWTRVADPELSFAFERFKSLEKRFQVGQAGSDEVAEMRHQVELLEARAPYRLNLRSSGGSLKEFLATVSKSSEFSFTLINAGDASDLDAPLPPFQLRNAHWGTVLEVLRQLLATRGLNLSMAGSDRDNHADAKAIVCVLRRDRGWSDPAVGARAPQFEVLGLADYIWGAQTVDVIVDAIQAAWQLDPSHRSTDLRIQFHPATKMLFVSGPEPAGHIAQRIIGGLAKNPVAR